MRTIQAARVSWPIYVDHPDHYNRTPVVTANVPPESAQFGLQQKLLDLPVEIFGEICAFLEPLDLRSLSISGRVFRGILMSRESRHIWASSRLRLYGTMPEPPKDMSEPQYVRFLFSPECDTCEAEAATIDHFNRIKSCSACYEKNFLTQDEAEGLYPGLPLHHMRSAPVNRRWDPKRPYHRSKIDPEYHLYLSQRSEDGPDWQTEYEAGLKTRCSSISEKGRVIRMWMYREKDRQEQVLEDLYERREKSILSRMLELGHQEEDVNYDDANKLGLLYLPHNVTDEEWATIRSALEEKTTKNKAGRLAKE